jgi:hypothetical protein
MVSKEKATEVKDKHSSEVLSRPGVWGIGVEKQPNGEWFIKISVDQQGWKHRGHFSKELEGVPVVVANTGSFQKL